MSNPDYTQHPSESQGSEALAQLGLDLRWSWNHAADQVWRRLDPELWDLTHNPWIILQTVSKQKLQSIDNNPEVQQLLRDLLEDQRHALESPGWFQQAHADSRLSAVAYFSMEFMLCEGLPIYSGGLGNVAGDQLKAASDLGVPVIGVGLLYQQGYFRQEIDADGNQLARYPFNDPGQLPISPVRDASGEWLRIQLELPGFRMWVRAWQAQVGRTRLYLLDTNDPANLPAHRGITSELYGGGPDLRLKQELVLGIAGWRLLRALGLRPEVCHLNEGHAAFAILERARSWMGENKQPFEVALVATRAGNLFTTHTPVAAGFDRFAPELVEKYLGQYAERLLGIPFRTLLGLGRQNPDDPSEPFNMAFLAVRGSGRINGVSRLHGQVSRRIFQPLFPRWPQDEVPVAHVTNGVHVPSWDCEEADRIWTAASGKDRWIGSLEGLEKDFRKVSSSDLWQLRTAARGELIEFTRAHLARQLAGQGVPAEQVAQVEQIFDPNTLTLGFARRFATYKRPNLLLHDTERLTRILTNRQMPVQLILAGKAHPQDLAGQAMIRQWVQFVRRPEVRAHAVFLSDYDMLLTERLVQGVDLWINTPRRPWEACGTSGMKVLVNGALNLSELDGWWAEAYSPDAGWAIGDGREHGEDPAWDAAEADALYTLLEREVVPQFYIRDSRGIPTAWVARMRESMARLTPAFSTNRAVRQYTEEHYLPAAAAYCARSAEHGKLAMGLLEWTRQVERHWPAVRFGSLTVEKEDGQFVFVVQVYLDELDPDAVCVELYRDTANGPFHQSMQRGQALVGSIHGYQYSTRVPADGAPNDYTPRVVPCKAGAVIPLETNRIVWQR
ncbi:MAG TPA: alpha-glucan family phosphorylase [Bryobacteraceae bacterium]|nr:alpha-glucan family phosphorylase [Bryobacteraceae bacterium]